MTLIHGPHPSTLYPAQVLGFLRNNVCKYGSLPKVSMSKLPGALTGGQSVRRILNQKCEVLYTER